MWSLIQMRRWFFFTWMIAVVLGGCASMEHPSPAPPSLEETTWGVEPLSLTLTASDFFLDFRFRVTDAQKASAVLSRRGKAYLIHEASGEILPVAVTKIGPLRAAAVDPKPYRTYVVLFSNIDRKVRTGDLATVVIGDFTGEGIAVGGRSVSVLDLDPEKRKSWEKAQKALLGDYADCIKACAMDNSCREKCRHDYNRRSDIAYRQLFSD